MAEADARTNASQGRRNISNLELDSGKESPDWNFEPERKIRGSRWAIVIISILSSVTLYSLDNTIVADIQPQIIDAFGEINKLPWLSVAFLISCVATNSIWYVSLAESLGVMRMSLFRAHFDMQGKDLRATEREMALPLLRPPFRGWLSDLCRGTINERFDRYLSTVEVLECSINTDHTAGGRVLAGLGGAGLYIGVMTLLSVNTTKRERQMYVGMTGLTWGLGTVLGPVRA